MFDIFEEMPTLKKLKNDIDGMRKIAFLAGKDVRKKTKELQNQLDRQVEYSKKYMDYFSNYGWILYSYLDMKMVEEAVDNYEKYGKDVAEKVIIEYYRKPTKTTLLKLSTNSEEFKVRKHLLQKAFEYHEKGEFIASVPIFLSVIDGAVNDFTKRKGFFTEGIDLSAWDCLVGSKEGLIKMRDIYNSSRKKTNFEEIHFPYRNGILHGRDLKYDNAYVSSKCIVLLLAINEWINKKGSEETRKEKFIEESRIPSIKDISKKIIDNQNDKKLINQWKAKSIVVGTDIPEDGKMEDYGYFSFLEPIVNLFECWNCKNYGRMSKILDAMFQYEAKVSLRPKECRLLFQNKDLMKYRVVEVEDRAISLKRVVVDVVWNQKEKGACISGSLEFGVVYTGEGSRVAIPELDNGNWEVRVWNALDLYK